MLLKGLVTLVRNRFWARAGADGPLQLASESFWRGCDNTYLADAAYYARRERVLASILSSLPRLDSVVDIGCGDGRFSCQLAARADLLHGYDLSPKLIERARARARDGGLDHVEFAIRSVDEVPEDRQYSLVSCMGVTCCLLDEDKYQRLLDRLSRLTMSDGWLLLVDSLSKGAARTVAFRSGYVARYRRRSTYTEEVLRRGFALEHERVVDSWSGLDNTLFVFRRRAPT